ncbi:hypothetical protein AVEN_183248-1 [Araneus ventricosus]|uniref:Uncharacterized protein n=1 Tax=Araneus ventricosus TaxID=182803 RepID=A0A4Y1ZNH2_ARAVE|nr:hypothetical protein AVEN_183248-1 [Araneus ventricosus]
MLRRRRSTPAMDEGSNQWTESITKVSENMSRIPPRAPTDYAKDLSSRENLSEVSAGNSPAACYPENLFEADTDKMFSFFILFYYFSGDI